MRLSWSGSIANDPLEGFSGKAELAIVLGSGLAGVSKYGVQESRLAYERDIGTGAPGFSDSFVFRFSQGSSFCRKESYL